MRITRVYTRTGDNGTTGLVDGSRVSKASLRVDAYGDVDELNSLLGLLRVKLLDEELDGVLAVIQNDLFILGADLASPISINVPRVQQLSIDQLETWADLYLEHLAPLKEFILPGGSEAGALMHLARTVSRRAERRVVALGESEEINPLTITYLNRLSDLLFVLAREINRRKNVAENFANFSARSSKK
ncbi:MAG: cob(I)yrinic acid a,c-diamide adenosyltransferase [Acidobacteria bacterium]|nr:cob(I)yrinic acid a,c-diamide adenosyltransferase [Acidobacteriota bacterium]